MTDLKDRSEELRLFSEFCRDAHDAANCKYDGKSYYTHVSMVEEGIDKYETVFLNYDDYYIARKGASGHDLIEDAKLTFNDIKKESNRRVAQVILAVTDVHEENRLLRHLFTMGKTVKDYIAIIDKMADMRANGLYSKTNGSGMYKKYVAEYKYRKPIFKMALKWYSKHLDQGVLDEFWAELDEIHDGEAIKCESKFDLVAFKEYVNTYTKTGNGCDDDNVIVKDMLYGIGTSLDKKKYSFAQGFAKFLKHVIKINKL